MANDKRRERLKEKLRQKFRKEPTASPEVPAIPEGKILATVTCTQGRMATAYDEDGRNYLISPESSFPDIARMSDMPKFRKGDEVEFYARPRSIPERVSKAQRHTYEPGGSRFHMIAKEPKLTDFIRLFSKDHRGKVKLRERIDRSRVRVNTHDAYYITVAEGKKMRQEREVAR